MTKECTFEEFVAALSPADRSAMEHANEQNRLACIAESKRIKRNARRRARDQAMRDIGMVKVRGNLGGTYWE
jgi:hypothetical protein